MVSFHEVRFPTDISYGAVGGPLFNTDIIQLNSGYEKRNINWAEARGRWDVAHGVKTDTQMSILIAFFRARNGRAIGFRFKDWADYVGEDQSLGTGDGITADWQIIKNYSSGGFTETRIISKIVAEVDVTVQNFELFVDSVAQTEGVDFTVDRNTGIISFETGSIPASGDSIVCSYEFDVPVRFDTDRMAASIDNFNTNTWDNIPVVELRI